MRPLLEPDAVDGNVKKSTQSATWRRDPLAVHRGHGSACELLSSALSGYVIEFP
jgi:hypothetical protein